MIAASVAKLGSKVSAKFASSAFGKLAAKTGGAVAAEFGSSLIDPLAGVGILLWDVWDYKHTVEKNRPVLRDTLLDYLGDMETALLKNSETGIMSSIYQLEIGIFNSLQNNQR